MGFGDLGDAGALVPALVVKELIPGNEIAIAQRQKMEERTVMLMGLVIKCLRAVVTTHVLVSLIFNQRKYYLNNFLQLYFIESKFYLTIFPSIKYNGIS